MPLIGLILPGNKGYEGWVWQVGDKGIPYGKFLGAPVNFLLIALVLYIFIVKFLGWLMKSQKDEVTVPPPPTRDQELLTEIRDLLKQSCRPRCGVQPRCHLMAARRGFGVSNSLGAGFS